KIGASCPQGMMIWFIACESTPESPPLLDHLYVECCTYPVISRRPRGKIRTESSRVAVARVATTRAYDASGLLRVKSLYVGSRDRDAPLAQLDRALDRHEARAGNIKTGRG